MTRPASGPSRRETLALTAGLSVLGTGAGCGDLTPVANEPVVDWDDEPWRYRPQGAVPRRFNPRPLPLHAPEFSRDWSDEYRAALLVAAPSTPSNGMPLLRRWLTRAWLDLPAWCRHPRLFNMLEQSASLPAPQTLEELAAWYPTPGLPEPWTDLGAWTEERLLDGFAAHPLQRSADGRIHLELGWDDVDRSGPYLLPNVQVTWEPRPAGWRMSRIHVEGRPVGPSDGAAWQHGLFVARSVALVAGETDLHLARCHLLVESVALLLEVHGQRPALARVHRLLGPFLRDVSGINRLGDALILGPAGLLPRSSGLGVSGLAMRLRHQLAQVDWKGFAPRGPEHPILGARFRYGQAAAAFWEGIGRLVEEALPDVAAGEVDALAQAVAAHNRHPTTPPAQRARPRAGRQWVWPTEVARTHPTDGHLTVPTSLDDVREFCRFVIFQATFAHSWTNDQGWGDAGSLYHAVFGLRTLQPPVTWDRDGFLRWWGATVPRLDDAIPQVSVGWVLDQARWGLFGDPDRHDTRETRDKGPELEVVRRLTQLIDPEPLQRMGLRPLAQWRIRVNT